MNLTARVKRSPEFRKYPVHKIRYLPGSKVKLFPETTKITAGGPSVDIMPEDLRFKSPQQILIRHLDMDEHAEQVLDKIVNKLV